MVVIVSHPNSEATASWWCHSKCTTSRAIDENAWNEIKPMEFAAEKASALTTLK